MRPKDDFLDAVLPCELRLEALRAQPGDVLKLPSALGWHLLLVEDVMLDLAAKRFSFSASESGLVGVEELEKQHIGGFFMLSRQ